MGLLKPKCYFGILCPHCELPRLRAEPAQVLPFPNLFPPAKAVTTGTTTTNYTTAGSYNYTVPAYNNMTVTVNGAGGGGGSTVGSDVVCTGSACGGGG